jgi:hypothetical protein
MFNSAGTRNFLQGLEARAAEATKNQRRRTMLLPASGGLLGSYMNSDK